MVTTAFAQNTNTPSDSLYAERLLKLLETLAEEQTGTAAGYGVDKPTYQLFKTTNIWVFLKLNTKNGTISIVHYTVLGGNGFESYINDVPLAIGENAVNGRFTLYPTENVTTFILLDQIDGRLWKVLWTRDSDKQAIIPIE